MPASAMELRVERIGGMIDVYRLVGLPRWESDPARIHQAIASARSALQMRGAMSHEQMQISGYVTEAERILTDANRKLKYDANLRRALQAAGEAEASLYEKREISTAANVSQDPDDSPVRPARSAAVRQRPVAPAPKLDTVPTPARSPVGNSVGATLGNFVSRFGGVAARSWETLHGGAPIRFTLALVFAGFVAILLWRRFDWDATFPRGTLSRRTADENSTTASLSPKPAAPSIPGHSVGRPRMVPGLEEFEGYAPTLDAGLTQIVFAVASGAENQRDFDLYLATRKNPSDSFQRPRRLDECSSSDRETDPTLSPDGLELVFVRTGSSGDATLMRSQRSSQSESFSEPETLSIPKLPSGPGVEYDSPQLLHDGGDLIVRVTERLSGEANPTYFVAPRYSAEEPFGNAAPLPVFVEKDRHFLTGDGLRAFVARRYRIQLCCRPTLDAPFSAPGRIGVLEASFTGMAEGPIWVSPAEDFLFYCVTTANESHQQRRSLRQVRIR